MDGYAVRARDTAGAGEASPRELRVIGEVAAGYVFDGAVEPGTAVRIMTGAPIPEGADAIVPFEETDEPFERPPSGAGALTGSVRVLKEAEAGANIRRAGEDVRAAFLELDGSVDILVSNLHLPGGGGPQLVTAVKASATSTT